MHSRSTVIGVIKMNKINYFFLLSLLVISPTICKTIQIDFTPYETYSIEVAHIDVGDTIEWLPNVDHNVEFLGGPNMNSLPEKSGLIFIKSILIYQSLSISLYLHGNMGMLGLVIVGNNHNLKDIEKIKLSPVAKSVLEKLIKESQSICNK